MSLSDQEEGSKKRRKEKDLVPTFSPILLVLVATGAGSVIQDVEVGSSLVAQVLLVAIAGPTVASGLSHVKPGSWSPHSCFPPGWGVVLQKIAVRGFRL